MPIVIKEMHVKTVIEKKVILPDKISGSIYDKLKEDIVEELSEKQEFPIFEKAKRER